MIRPMRVSSSTTELAYFDLDIDFSWNSGAGMLGWCTFMKLTLMKKGLSGDFAAVSIRIVFPEALLPWSMRAPDELSTWPPCCCLTFRGEPAAIVATQRFSNLGIFAVGTLLVTGVINTWNLVGSVGAFFSTGYGRLLMVKVALFLMMIGIATVNRLQLSPRLEVDGTTRKLERNSLIEAGLGVIVLLIVGALGTLPPAIHDYAGHMH